MLSFHVKFVQTDGQTMVQQYAPILRCRGIIKGHNFDKTFYGNQSMVYVFPL